MCSNLIPRRTIAEVIMNCPHQESEGRLPSASTIPLVAKWRTGMGLGRWAMMPPTAEVSLPKVMPADDDALDVVVLEELEGLLRVCHVADDAALGELGVRGDHLEPRHRLHRLEAALPHVRRPLFAERLLDEKE